MINSVRSKCSCLTNTGRPCSRDAMPESEFCWQHKKKTESGKYSLLDVSEYLYDVDRKYHKTCYDRPDQVETPWMPDYTIIYSPEELRQIDDSQLRLLYGYYHIDTPNSNSFHTVLNGYVPFNPVRPQYLENIVKEFVQRYYPIESRLSESDPELLIRGLEYFYRLIDKYGINTSVTSNQCITNVEEYDRLKSTVQPLVTTESIKLDQDFIEPFVEKYYQWFAEQFEQLLPFSTQISKYIDFGYQRMNSICRSKSMDQSVQILLNAFTVASPLPTDIVVTRYLFNMPDNFDASTGEGIETGFMSVSLSHRNIESLFKTGFNYYLTLYVPRGTILLNLLFYNLREYELLLPPGTRFKIYETSKLTKKDGKIMTLYSGMIC